MPPPLAPKPEFKPKLKPKLKPKIIKRGESGRLMKPGEVPKITLVTFRAPRLMRALEAL